MTRQQMRTHSVRLDEEDVHELGDIADSEGRNISDLIRESVHAYIEMRSKRRIVVELTPDSLENLQYMVERGFVRSVQDGIDRAVDGYIDERYKVLVERNDRRRKLDEWAREEKRVQF